MSNRNWTSRINLRSCNRILNKNQTSCLTDALQDRRWKVFAAFWSLLSGKKSRQIFLHHTFVSFSISSTTGLLWFGSESHLRAFTRACVYVCVLIYVAWGGVVKTSCMVLAWGHSSLWVCIQTPLKGKVLLLRVNGFHSPTSKRKACKLMHTKHSPSNRKLHLRKNHRWKKNQLFWLPSNKKIDLHRYSVNLIIW